MAASAVCGVPGGVWGCGRTPVRSPVAFRAPDSAPRRGGGWRRRAARVDCSRNGDRVGDDVKFGAHVSISGIHLAIDRAVAIGCECLQIFVGNPRQWRRIEYGDADVALFREKRARAGLDPVVAHSAYLINLASPEDAFYARSVASLIASVDGISRLGSRMGLSREEAAARVAAALRVVLDHTEGVMVILENSAGAGGAIGGTFEELAAILDALEGHPRLGGCLGTAPPFPP